MLGAFYYYLIIRFTSIDDPFFQTESMPLVFQIMMYLDLVIANLMLVLFGWNMYVLTTGYT